LRIFLLLLAICGAARAEDAVTSSRQHYNRGRELYLANYNAEALREFQAGYELAPRPEFLINMGLCQSRLGRLTEARDLYQKFLAAAPESHKQRQNVEDLLQKVEAELAARPPETAPPPKETPPRPVSVAVVAAPAVLVATAPPQREKSFARRHWWIFPVVGVVVAGVAVGLGVGLSHKSGCDGQGLCVDASQ
jgi:tetratricopeptide (TPR) repeat protein